MAPLFSRREIERRWREVLARVDVDAVVAPSFWNSYYLSGVPVVQWGRYAITILFRERDHVLVLPSFEAAAAEANSPVRELRLYIDEQGPSLETATALTADALRSRHTRRVGIEAAAMPARMYLQLTRALPSAQFEDVSDTIDEVRLISSAEEIAYLRVAARLADHGIARILDLIRPGAIETELAREARHAIESQAPRGAPVEGSCYLQQGIASLETHRQAQQRAIQPGQLVEVNCVCSLWHYQPAIERAIAIGDLPAATERAYHVTLEAYAAAVAALRPGTAARDVDAAARAVFANAGYTTIACGAGFTRNILHHTGGRIEAGNLRTYNQRNLEPGMVITVGPFAQIADIGGPHHGDMFLITQHGAERLTQTPTGRLRIHDT
jgi:Xaa-Pro dipeptidase